ncbi:DsbA family protein [soil metagenome]
MVPVVLPRRYAGDAKPASTRITKPVATKPKRPAKYDLKAADRKRNMAIQIGLTAVVIIFATALILYIVMGSDKKQGGEVQAVRVASSEVITNEGTSDPKAVISLFEDFQCPACRNFEQAFGPTLNKLVDAGAIAIDYHSVAILNSPVNDNYSTRAGNAGYCVAEEDTSPMKDAFRRFHGALFAQQPAEGSPAPDNTALIETARQSGVVGGVAECISKGNYNDVVDGMSSAAGITATPTVRLNGEDYRVSTPEALVDKVKEIVGDVPGLDGAATPPAS